MILTRSWVILFVGPDTEIPAAASPKKFRIGAAMPRMPRFFSSSNAKPSSLIFYFFLKFFRIYHAPITVADGLNVSLKELTNPPIFDLIF